MPRGGIVRCVIDSDEEEQVIYVDDRKPTFSPIDVDLDVARRFGDWEAILGHPLGSG